ncbi:RSP_2648 family PIN domain-containing protein [Gemmobacter serpentinus]|uniref:RSP_2648 family PIN domain-containing protein n=1 Tax=Gemmobacter serpentinus TaxID=2652247 RepID=UPI00124F439F|nr:PIN domain-containing protein [Gemmobacter serpentinus]
MRVTLDACVIFPSVLRTILLRAARAGLYEPVWSDRILEEWQRAIPRLGAQAAIEAAEDAARMRRVFPRAMTAPHPEIEARHILPDPDDLHVLATAIASGSDAILTFNAADFPGHVLAAEGITRRDPDGFLWELHSRAPAAIAGAIHDTHQDAERLAGQTLSLKAMLKRSRLNRLAKAIAA